MEVAGAGERTGTALDAIRLLNKIGHEFNKNRDKSQPAAFRQLNHSIMENLGTLAQVMSPKDLLTAVRENEDFVKGGQGGERDPVDAVMKWLSDDEPADPK